MQPASDAGEQASQALRRQAAEAQRDEIGAALLDRQDARIDVRVGVDAQLIDVAVGASIRRPDAKVRVPHEVAPSWTSRGRDEPVRAGAENRLVRFRTKRRSSRHDGRLGKSQPVQEFRIGALEMDRDRSR